MMTLRHMPPSPALAPFVEQYGIRLGTLGARQIHTALPARADCFLEFYLADRYRIVNVASGEIHRAPRLVLVGPHTRRREDLLLSGTLRVFNIRFTPIGFRTLFGIPARHLVDSAESADDVLGAEVHGMADRLSTATTPAELWRIAEDFLLARLASVKAPGTAGPVAGVARLLAKHNGAGDIAALAARAQVSTRQLERLFHEYVGVSPKTFARLARLKFALELGERGPARDWAAIANTAGFYDQSHMVRDFTAMTGESPDRFFALRQKSALNVSNATV